MLTRFILSPLIFARGHVTPKLRHINVDADAMLFPRPCLPGLVVCVSGAFWEKTFQGHGLRVQFRVNLREKVLLFMTVLLQDNCLSWYLTSKSTSMEVMPLSRQYLRILQTWDNRHPSATGSADPEAITPDPNEWGPHFVEIDTTRSFANYVFLLIRRVHCF